MTKFDHCEFSEILRIIINDSDPRMVVLDLSRRKVTDIEAQQIIDALDEGDNKTLKQVVFGENPVSIDLQEEINSKLKLYPDLEKQEVESEEEELGYLPAVSWNLFAPPTENKSQIYNEESQIIQEARRGMNAVRGSLSSLLEEPKELRPSPVRASPRMKHFKVLDLSSVKEKVENHEGEIAALKAKNADLSSKIEDLKDQVNKLANPVIAEEIVERTAKHLSRKMSERLDEELGKLASSAIDPRPSASVKAKEKKISKITESALEKHNYKSRSSI